MENELKPRFLSAITDLEMAKLIGMSVGFLRKDRITKRLIPYFKIGDSIRYNPERVMQALAALEEGGPSKSSRRVTVSKQNL